MNTGVARAGLRPRCLGHYGLGSENRNLPGFVVLGNTQGIKGRAAELSRRVPAHDLPGDAVPLAGQPDPQPQAAPDTADEDQRRSSTSLARLNGEHLPSRGSLTSGADPGVRAGLPHADGGDGPRGFLAGTSRTRELYGSRIPRRGRSAGSACWPAGWWSGGCSSRSTATASGTPTATWPATTRPPRGHGRADPRPAERPERQGPSTPPW